MPWAAEVDETEVSVNVTHFLDWQEITVTCVCVCVGGVGRLSRTERKEPERNRE